MADVTDTDWYTFLNRGVPPDPTTPATLRTLRRKAIADGIRVMVTRNGIDIPEAVIIERANNILQVIEGFDPGFDDDTKEGDPT